MATTKLCKLYYGTNLSTLNFRHTATDSANLAYTIKDTETSTDLVSGTISHDTLTDLVPIMWVNSAVNGTEYDLYVDDTVAVINLSCSSIENENISSYVEFYPTNPVMIGLTTFICNHNHLLTTGLTFPSFTNALNLVNINNNQLTSATLDALILKVWSNAITNLQLSKAFNVSGNAGTPSTQSTAYLTALNDNRSFKWIINSASPSGSGTVHIKTAADLQTLAVNLAADAICDNHIEGAITHTWGADVPDYTLVIPSTITTGTLAAITNGAITINGAAQTVCGVYFDTSKVLAGFYVTGTTATAGAVAQSTTFASSGCAVYPIKHFYRDLPAEVYATEKAKIFAGTLYDITDVDGLTYQPLVYNDNLKRIYYRGQIIAVGGVQAKSGFVPIGQSTAFTGNFDCKDYEIRDCHVFSNLQNVSIIGYQDGVNTSTKTTIIKSVGHTIIAFGYNSTSLRVGLIGYNYRYRITNNSYSTGSTSGAGNSDTYVGGLVGYNDSSSQVNNSYSTGSTSGIGNDRTYVGGLVGYSNSSSQVNNSYSTGSTNGTGTTNTYIGGLVGRNNSSSQVNNSYSTGSISGIGTTSTDVGGLVGYSNSSQVNDSYSTGSISGIGTTSTLVGGLVGYNDSSSQVNNSYSTGSINGTGTTNTWVGGLVGYNRASSQVNNSFGFNDVSGLNGVTPLAIRGIYNQDSSSSATNVYQLGQVADYTVGGFTVCKGLTAAQFKDKANFATVTANYTGLARITTHVTTNQYLAYTIVYNSTRTALYICNTAITTGTVALTDERWQELVFNEIEQVIFTDYLYTEDETGLVIKARETGSEDWITISVHNPTYRTYANTERVITADGKCYVALQNVPLTTAITNTAYWLEDTGFNFNTIWRMGNLYPELMAFYIATYNFFKQNFGSSNFIFKQRG